jgi:EAL domain-containing protein (putative c-di-GMP-specific phosphodiesterase class I)
MIRSIIEMAHTMKMITIVEGVEEKAQLELIEKLGADEVQGFLLGRPADNPVAQLAAHLQCSKEKTYITENAKLITVGKFLVAP